MFHQKLPADAKGKSGKYKDGESVYAEDAGKSIFLPLEISN